MINQAGLLFSGATKRTNPALKWLRTGTPAMLQVVKAKQPIQGGAPFKYTADSQSHIESFEPIQIVAIKPHHGKEIAGRQVKAEDVKPGTDMVDLVTIRHQDGKEETFLQGSYTNKQGEQVVLHCDSGKTTGGFNHTQGLVTLDHLAKLLKGFSQGIDCYRKNWMPKPEGTQLKHDGVTVFYPKGKQFGLYKGVITIKDNGLETPSVRWASGTDGKKEPSA
jgi:hypothetical protein